MLALSSFPIHLMFNSAVFVSLTANEYTVAVATQDFVDGANFTLPVADPVAMDFLRSMQQNLSTYERLDPIACIQAYGVDFLSDRRHILAVVLIPPDAGSGDEGANEKRDNDDAGDGGDDSPSNSTDTGPLLGYLDWTYDAVQNSWVCGTSVDGSGVLVPEDINDFDCDVGEALSDLPITFGDWQLDHCLSERVVDRCRLQFSLPIMFVVIACNAIKLVAILATLLRKQSPLLTLGDAIASFLERPDPTTRGMGTASIADFRAGRWRDDPLPQRWEYTRHFRWEAVGLWRWAATNGFAFATLCIFAALLYEAINTTTTNPDLATWWGLGFGTVTASSLVRWPANQTAAGHAGLLRNVLLANVPQLLLSALYLAYNAAYTCMAFADEYARYFAARRGLRVTNPLPKAKGNDNTQRSTRFLTLPYRYVAPLLLASGGAHFLLSQAFFLVAVDVFGPDGDPDPQRAILTVGFSPIAMVILFIALAVALLLALLLGWRRLRVGMPLAGPCSAAISAACHVAAGESGAEAARRLIRWGVVGSEGGVGHLSFSAGPVSEPVPGRLYR
ncbi:hypothetical protein B0T24DRAFT_616099 [Lasiosphaeria ovina]|uniref:DUF6536 domain-containing protein n=1 Tax=Lasiosphaeria ovina TaxID=92902 RepID=A0AAE0TV96_9PEZI|nr:hypothetical protein B0T24DRAFT_616099 [Lasiosphaeria ovina]